MDTTRTWSNLELRRWSGTRESALTAVRVLHGDLPGNGGQLDHVGIESTLSPDSTAHHTWRALTHTACCLRHTLWRLQALRMDLMDTLGYNTSLAEALAQAHALTGTWRSITASLRTAEALTSGDIQEVRGNVLSSKWRLGSDFTSDCTAHQS